MATTEMNSEESSRRSLLDEPELKDWIRPTSESWTAGDKATEINHGPPPSFAALCREGVVASELRDHHAYYTRPSFYGAFRGLFFSKRGRSRVVQPLTSGHTFGYGGAGNIETFLGGQHAFTRASQGLLARHILAEASDAVAVQLNYVMLLEAAAARAATAAAAAQFLGFDEAGGRFLAIDMDAQQQEKGDQDFVVASRTINDGLRDLAQRILQSLLGGLVPLSLTFLHDACKDDCPKYIKLVAYTGLGVVTGLTYLGLILEKRAKAAVRVAASTSIAAVTIAAVLQVHNVYGQCIVGILGATGTLATAALSW